MADSDGCAGVLGLAIVLFAVYQCSNHDASSQRGEFVASGYGARDWSADHVREAGEESRRDELYGSSYESESYAYGCTQDCSGHEAGWQWAQDNDVQDPYDCGGTSQSFTEGCMAYAEEVQAAGDEAVDEALAEAEADGW